MMESKNSLIKIIKQQTEVLFTNLFSQIEQADITKEFDGLPNNRYLFHAIHSADRWFINPDAYVAPDLDITGVEEMLSVIDEKRSGFTRGSEIDITREQLKKYGEYVHKKIQNYLDTLTDNMLSEVVDKSHPYTRLDLILAQFRHFMFHIGLSTAVTVNTGKPWPEYTGYKWVHEKEK